MVKEKAEKPLKIYDVRLDAAIPYKATPDGLIGMELELEGQNFVNVNGWMVKNENSLRGGMEYILPVPESIQTLKLRLLQFNGAVKQHGMVLNQSFRTSTHIHVNVQKRTFRQVAYATAIWTLFEQYILSLLPGLRSGNLFCLSSRDTGEFPMFIQAFVERAQYNFFPGLQERGKYAACNTNHLQGFGSLEFRVFPQAVNDGKLDVDRLIGWATICAGIVDKAEDFKEVSQLIRFINLARTDPVWALRQLSFDIQGEPYLVSMAAEDAYEMALAIKKGEEFDQNKRYEVKEGHPRMEELEDQPAEFRPYDDDDDDDGN